MSIEIYPPDFSTRYQLTHAVSIQMTVYYNEIGKIQLVVPVDDYNIAALREGSMLYDTVRGTTYVIVNPKQDTTQNRITCNGYTTNWLLNRRVVAARKALTAVESGVYDLVNDNLRGLPRIKTAAVKGSQSNTNRRPTKTTPYTAASCSTGASTCSTAQSWGTAWCGTEVHWNTPLRCTRVQTGRAGSTP